MAKNGDPGKSPTGMFRNSQFKYAFILLVTCFIFYVIAFASPYWLQTYHSVPLDFKNMGLWEICFSKYFYREDIYAQKYEGCYWAFAIDLEFRRDVFNPGFFVMVQVFSVVVLSMLSISLIIASVIFLRAGGEQDWSYWITSIIQCGLTAISGLLLFAIVVTVGVKSGDRQWMPRADLIWLSWGYAFAVAASFFALLSAYFFGKEARDYWGAKMPTPELFGIPLYRQGDAAEEPPMEGASVY